MSGLIGQTPREVFSAFHDHVQRLLNQTVIGSRLRLFHGEGTEYASFSSLGPGGLGATPIVRSPLYLYIGQQLVVRKTQAMGWKLKTVKYRYIIQEGPNREDRQILRFDYLPPEQQKIKTLHPRHHVHISTTLGISGKTHDLVRMHLPTGWVTIEELIRFLITELGVKPKAEDWDELLRKSEANFRAWTGRDV